MNFTPASDTLMNVVEQQIKPGIRVCLREECFGSALILIYSGIDSMAFLSMPAGQDNVRASDFIAWCNRYISFCRSGQVTGEEFYSARCGFVHTYTIDSNLTRKGRCRHIGYYFDLNYPPVVSVPSVTNDFLLVNIRDLAEAFFEGMSKSLVALFSNPRLAKVAESRLERAFKVIAAEQMKRPTVDRGTPLSEPEGTT